MIKMTRFAAYLVLISGLSIGTGFAAVQAHDVKIATVDMQKALQSVEAGKKAKKKLENFFTQRKKELDQEKAQLEKAAQELQKQAAVMSEKALAKKQAELQERAMKFQQKTAQSQQELQKREQELTQPIIDKLRGVISKIAEKKGYTVVLEKSENNVLYSQEKNDMTQAVIDAYNK